MLKQIWYRLFKIFISTGLFFFFKKIKIHNEENLPKKGAILLVSNHKNALIDPLLIATSTKRSIHFLTRASAFKLKLVYWFLSTLNMIPIYRMRDGKGTLAKNEAIFNKCYELLNKKKCLLIFPEGTHNIKRWVNPLSKGFTRITFGALEQNTDLELHLVPVGLNYTNATDFAESVSIYYGKPILANDFYNKEQLNASTVKLKNEVHKKLTELTTNIEDIENYDSIVDRLGDVDYLNPRDVNIKISNFKSHPNIYRDKSQIPFKNKRPSLLWKTLKGIVAINSFIPLLIFKAFLPKIKEIEFVSTTKFAIGLTAFPLFYSLQSLVIDHFFGLKYAIVYFLISIFSVLILAKTK
jgi:1-acyl-sn-glycerol-3-phosphate acyltransferase